MRHEALEEWKILYDTEPHDLHLSATMITEVKSRRMGGMERVSLI